METRPAVESDEDAVDRVIREAFGEEGEAVAAIWRDLVATGLVQLSLIAVDGRRVVGHVGISHAWLDARRELVDVLLLSPLSVLPGLQGRGIGTALLAAALPACAGLGRPLVALEGDPGYYGARGFRPGSEAGITPPSDRTPLLAFQVATFDGWRDWMTGRLVYPDVWWRHDAAGLRDPLLAELEERLS